MREEQRPPIEEVTELAPGIRRIQLPMNMPGLGHVNCYVLDDERGVALVDPGLPGPGPWRALKAGLRRAGLRLRDVHTVVITHSHPDHFGAAGRIHETVGADVITHRDFRLWWTPHDEDRDFVEEVDGAGENDAAIAGDPLVVPSSRLGPGGPTPWGGERFRFPLHRRFTFWALRRGFSVPWFRTPEPTTHVIDGDLLLLGGREWVAVHTPGHTVDHLCLLDPASGLMIAGDHILPTITPHISGLGPITDPLTDYFDSLDKAAEIAGVSMCLPAHGLEFDNLAGRAKDIRRHHEQRLQILRDAGGEIGGPASVNAYMKKLFKERAWGPMAESETFAHLEHLRREGEVAVSRDERDEVLLYAFG